MTRENEDQIYTEAVSWHAQIDRPEMDWDGFASWLDSSPEHQAVYDRVAMLDDDVGLMRDEIRAALPANDLSYDPVHVESPLSTAPARSWRWWTTGGIAAALVAAVMIPTLTPSPVTMTDYSTGPGGTRIVPLKDGSSVRLDRNTRLAVADDQDRVVRLDAGAAYFDVRHDKARPFVVRSGDFKIRDLGTQFSVTRYASGVLVAVAHGRVEVQFRDQAAQSLEAGQELNASERGEASELRPVDPTSVASWRDGRLAYDNVPLALIVKDLSRYSPRSISVDPGVANLTFSGVLTIGDGTHLVDQLQLLMPIKARVDGDGIRLVGAGRSR
jgi:transmembrane sensor